MEEINKLLENAKDPKNTKTITLKIKGENHEIDYNFMRGFFILKNKKEVIFAYNSEKKSAERIMQLQNH